MEKITEMISDEELVELFNQTISVQEKLNIFGRIQDESYKIELLNNIPQNEKYKFIGKLRNPEDIAIQLKGIEDEKSKIKTFNYIAKQYKGNSKKFLELLESIDFTVQLPENSRSFNLNNFNDMNMDSMIKIQENVENSSDIMFKINEQDAEKVEYSFAEMSAIVAKLEELTAGIPESSSEFERFFTIYYRITNNITYNYETVSKTNDEIKKSFEEMTYSRFELEKIKEIIDKRDKKVSGIRRDSAGMYGGLIDGKAICVGYATILHEALKRVGIKSQIVLGLEQKKGVGLNVVEGHAWNQVQIDGKWYNADATWDAVQLQRTGGYDFCLRGDNTFGHKEFPKIISKNTHVCKEDNKIDNFMVKKIVSRNMFWGGIRGGR